MTKGSIFARPGALGGPVVGKSNFKNDGKTVMQRFKHKGLNSLYYI